MFIKLITIVLKESKTFKKLLKGWKALAFLLILLESDMRKTSRLFYQVCYRNFINTKNSKLAQYCYPEISVFVISKKLLKWNHKYEKR
jgi:hypothetical protein